MRFLDSINPRSHPLPFDFGIPASEHTENIGALRMIFEEAEFLAWLDEPNKHLFEATPRELVASGKEEIVADLAVAMLTGGYL